MWKIAGIGLAVGAALAVGAKYLLEYTEKVYDEEIGIDDALKEKPAAEEAKQ